MTEREQIEAEIRELIRTESRTVTLSNKLFAPDGLFSRLASTEDEQRIVGKSALFKEAQRRIRELENKDAAALRTASAQAHAQLPNADFRVRFEPIPSATSTASGS